MPPLIEARDLVKSFGGVHAVQGVSLQVSAGEAYGLVGPDGAGKTTTLRMLVGALTPDSGSAQVAGFDLRRQTEQARARLGYLAQRFSLYGDLTVQENLRFFGQVRGVKGEALSRRAEELLRFVGLSAFGGRRADLLSGGMKQKLGLACALIHEPRVLLLDEPTGGVDPVTRQDFWQLIIRVLAGGAAVIISTPYMDEAVRCNRLGFLQHGRLLVQGAPRELTAALAGRVLELAAHPKDKARAVAQADADVEDVIAFGDRFHLRVRGQAGPLARLPAALAQAGITVERLRPAPPSLEDVFISLLQSDPQSAQATP
ncbi:MAG: ABC transporter ATP-binding protein [Anaerolineales bacterium]